MHRATIFGFEGLRVRLGKTLLVTYVSVGLLVSAVQFDKSLRTFTCSDETAPHGETGLYQGKSYKNPDPMRCRRHAFSASAVTEFVGMIFIGPPVVLIRSLR